MMGAKNRNQNRVDNRRRKRAAVVLSFLHEKRHDQRNRGDFKEGFQYIEEEGG